MTLYGLDPGTTQSALAWAIPGDPVRGIIWRNEDILTVLRRGSGAAVPAVLVIEQIEGMGMAVGREVFETVCWAGRFCEA